ncbi:aldo/keto reductase (plasmid) [Ralstonia wenshanensis]|nr:aldo/keto reductase [Ralstonia wenshanensis]UGS88825.1 aldo/keto reductase [Ralstonia wenshanensis]
MIQRPGIASTLMGVSKVEQLHDNIEALNVRLSPDHLDMLDKVSAPTQKMLYSLFTPQLRQHAVFGGSQVRSWAG